jgi:hypothetical protein
MSCLYFSIHNSNYELIMRRAELDGYTSIHKIENIFIIITFKIPKHNKNKKKRK